MANLTGNVIQDAPIVDPEGHEVRIAFMKPYAGSLSLPKVDVPANGDLVSITPNGSGDSGAEFRISANGAWEFDKGTLDQRSNTKVTTVSVAVYYTDGKNIDHIEDASADGHVTLKFEVSGVLAPNEAPTAPAELTYNL